MREIQIPGPLLTQAGGMDWHVLRKLKHSLAKNHKISPRKGFSLLPWLWVEVHSHQVGDGSRVALTDLRGV